MSRPTFGSVVKFLEENVGLKYSSLELDHDQSDIPYIRSRGATWGSGELLEAVKPEGRQQVCHDVHSDLQV